MCSQRTRAVPQQGRRALWGAPHLPGLTQALAFCRTLIYTWGFGAGRAAEEALHQHRGCLPGGCPCAGAELPGCASPALASLSSTTDANGSRQAGSSGKDQTPGARGCCQCETGHSEPSWEWQPHRLPCLVMPLRKCCVRTWLQRGAAGRVQAGACRGAAHAASMLRQPRQGLAVAQDHAMGRGYRGLPALDFRSGGMYKPLPGCRNKWPRSSRWALLTGMLLCPAPPQGLRPSFSVASGGQRGRQPRNTALLGTAAESPPPQGRVAAPACVSRWKLQPPAPGSCRAGGCGRTVLPR